MVRRKRGRLSQISDDIKPIVRDITKRARNVHPEIWARWVEIVGGSIASRAIPDSFRRGKLFVAVASSAWMQELSYLKQTLIDRFDEAVGRGVVRDIHFVLSPELKAMGDKETPPDPDVKPRNVELPSTVKHMLGSIEDESLRDVVEKAAKASFSRDEKES